MPLLAPPRTNNPPKDPVVLTEEGDEDKCHQVILYGEDEQLVSGVVEGVAKMSDWLTQGRVKISGFTDIDALDSEFQKKIQANPKLLISLTYILTSQNVNRCLSSYLALLKSVPGHGSSDEFSDDVKSLGQKVLEAGLLEEDEAPFAWAEKIKRKHEPRARIVGLTNSVHFDEAPLDLNGELGLMLDRWRDIGKDISTLFKGESPLMNGPGGSRGLILSDILMKPVSDFGLFGDDGEW